MEKFLVLASRLFPIIHLFGQTRINLIRLLDRLLDCIFRMQDCSKYERNQLRRCIRRVDDRVAALIDDMSERESGVSAQQIEAVILVVLSRRVRGGRTDWKILRGKLRKYFKKQLKAPDYQWQLLRLAEALPATFHARCVSLMTVLSLNFVEDPGSDPDLAADTKRQYQMQFEYAHQCFEKLTTMDDTAFRYATSVALSELIDRLGTGELEDLQTCLAAYNKGGQ